MIVGKIVGSVVATRKNDKLVGSKFMIVEPIDNMPTKYRMVAVDNVGATEWLRHEILDGK